MSEIEDRCAEKLREMEVQVNMARREHTKAGSRISTIVSAGGRLTQGAKVISVMQTVI